MFIIPFQSIFNCFFRIIFVAFIPLYRNGLNSLTVAYDGLTLDFSFRYFPMHHMYILPLLCLDDLLSLLYHPVDSLHNNTLSHLLTLPLLMLLFLRYIMSACPSMLYRIRMYLFSLMHWLNCYRFVILKIFSINQVSYKSSLKS